MAYFKWRGVDLNGSIKVGKLFARTEKDLSDTLFGQEISLISCFETKSKNFLKKISLESKIHFFRQLAVLLDSGVRLPEALQVLNGLIDDTQLKDIICSVVGDVQEGLSFSDGLKRYPNVFNSLVVRMVKVGQESGRLSSALEQLSEYLETTQTFRKKLKSASAVPLITFGFFIFVTFAIFTLVIPRFANIFKSMKRELPSVTSAIIWVSEFLRSSSVIFVLIGIVFLILAIRLYMKSSRGLITIDKVVLRLPWIGNLVRNSSLVYFLQSVSMLLTSGVRLIKAMDISKKSRKNSFLKESISIIEKEVESGTSMSQAMGKQLTYFYEQDLIALAKVGEESGRLGQMLKKGAEIYQAKVNRSLKFFTTIFQPLLMIILGLLITLLIFSIYLPVFSLSSVL